MSEWDTFGESLRAQETTIRNMDATVMQAGADDEKLAVLWVKIEEMMDALKAQRAHVASQLAANVRPAIGEFPRMAGDYSIVVGWPEKMDWDKDKLEEIIGKTNAMLPTFVDEKITIDKKAWDKADATEKAPYLEALTIKPGTRYVRVEKIG